MRFFFPAGSPFLQMFVLKSWQTHCYVVHLSASLAGGSLWVLWDVGKYSEPHTSCNTGSCVPPALMQKLSQCTSCSPFSQAVCEKEKNTFPFSLQAQAMKVGLALECSCPSSKAFKRVINPSSFSNVQTQLSFTKCDLGVYSN